MKQPVRLLLAACLSWLASCAEAPRVAEKQPFPTAAPAPASNPGAPSQPAASARALGAAEVQKLDPKSYAQRFQRPVFCEEAARNLQPLSRDKAWAVLMACVEKGNFTLISQLIAGPWDDDLRRRPDAPLLVAKLVASRGGDVVGDVAKFRSRKVPLFALESAVKQPEVYKGRLLVLRAAISDIRTQQGKTTVRLLEKGFTSYDKAYRAQTTGRQTDSHSDFWGDDYRTKYRFFNEQRETGLEVLGRLAQADPFLEPGKDFVIVGRFDGMRETPGEEERAPESIAVLTVIGYFEPAAAIVE